MKILTKFEDYYDPCQYMCGEDIVYERVMNNRKRVIVDNTYQKSERIIEDSRLPELDKLYKSYFSNNPFRNLQTSILFIGDTIVQFLHYTKEMKDKDNKISYEEVFLYKEDEILDFYDKELKYMNKNLYIKDKNKLKDFQKRVREIIPEIPLIYFGTFSGSDNGSYHETMNHITLNPMLKQLKFQSKMESFEVIQEIELFLNKIGCVEKETSFTDKEKIAQAGFDLKKSFRK